MGSEGMLTREILEKLDAIYGSQYQTSTVRHRWMSFKTWTNNEQDASTHSVIMSCVHTSWSKLFFFVRKSFNVNCRTL